LFSEKYKKNSTGQLLAYTNRNFTGKIRIVCPWDRCADKSPCVKPHDPSFRQIVCSISYKLIKYKYTYISFHENIHEISMNPHFFEYIYRIDSLRISIWTRHS